MTMKAVLHHRYGGSEVLEISDVETPTPAADEVLVRVRATSLNRVDWYGMAGRPYAGRAVMGLRAPKSPRLGGDFAGVVETVGEDVTDFAPDDEVYGFHRGALAEYVACGDAVERKPANLTFEEAAAVPLGALTALQGLRDHGGVRDGHKVLVNGASGGVGTFAVQLAKALGADVTAVCSTRNVERARSLGADRVVDYTREDFTRLDERFDVVFDNAGTRSWRATTRVLAPEGTVVLVGGSKDKRLFGPLGHVARLRLASKIGGRRAVFFVAKPNRPDLAAIRELVEGGKVRPVVERRYDLRAIGDAFRYMGEGHVQGKLVVTM